MNLSGQIGGKGLVRKISELAFGGSNDAVKLAFLDPEQPELIDKLDLRMVSEVKKGSSGAVEVKLINRIALLELLAELVKETEAPLKENGAESFFTAMDKAAAKLGVGGHEV